MLKVATEKDVEDILILCHNFFKASPYTNMEYSWEQTSKSVNYFISDPKALALLIEHEGKNVGVLLATSQEMLFCKDRVASEIVWWVDPEYRGKESLELLNAFEYWARKIGCKRMVMVSLDDERVNRIYTKRNYKRVETSYMKEL